MVQASSSIQFCPFCGKPFTSQTQECEYCGKSLPSSPATTLTLDYLHRQATALKKQISALKRTRVINNVFALLIGLPGLVLYLCFSGILPLRGNPPPKDLQGVTLFMVYFGVGLALNAKGRSIWNIVRVFGIFPLLVFLNDFNKQESDRLKGTLAEIEMQLSPDQ